MKKEDAEEFTQSLGQIVGGSWRQIELAKELGVPKALGLSVGEWVEKRLGGYVRLAVDDRRKAARELADEGNSTRAIGEVLGVGKTTVERDLAGPFGPESDTHASNDAIAHDEGGPNGPAAPLDALATLAASEQVRDAIENAERQHNHRAQGTGENEWYTPGKYIEAARQVLGEISVDPASSAVAQETVQAVRFFSADDDGLSKQWCGRVWMNPPYSQPEIQLFIEKLVAEVLAGRTTGAIALTHNYTDTEWFHTAARACKAICFTRGRIRFVNPKGESAAPTQGQAFFYFGEDADYFCEVFSQFGIVVSAT